MTEPLRPPKESASQGSIGWFAARNAAWGSLLGLIISIAWLVIIQDFWFAIHICLTGAALSAVYGAICSAPALLAGRAAPRLRLLLVGSVFAGMAMMIQVGLLALLNYGWALIWNAVAYSLLGAVVAVLVFRSARSEKPADGPTVSLAHSSGPPSR